MDTTAVAEHFGITPKNLRRTLRKMGIKAPYDITEDVMNLLAEKYEPAVEEQTWLDEDEALPVAVAQVVPSNTQARRVAASKWQLRQARLNQRLKSLQHA